MPFQKAAKTVEVVTASTLMCSLLLFLSFVFGTAAFAQAEYEQIAQAGQEKNKPEKIVQAEGEKFVQTENWMTALSDTLPLTALSIPGAHDAATASIHGRGRCQTLTIAELLRAGVRAFDLRPTLSRRSLRKTNRTPRKENNTPRLGNIYHSLKSTGLSMDEVFADFEAFLKEQPSEMLVVILRDESDGRYLFRKPSKEKYAAALCGFLGKQKRLLPFSDTLRLGTARGKILILSRNDLRDAQTAHVNWSHSISGSRSRSIFFGAGKAASLFVQDCYAPKMIASDCSIEDFARRKLCAAENLLDAAAAAKHTWVINHASAYVGKTNYCRNAELQNARLANYIRGKAVHCCSGKSKPAGATGILMMDFAGADEAKYRGKTYSVCGKNLLQAVIENNF